MKAFPITIISLAILTGSALAADPILPASHTPAPAADTGKFDWEGVYVGIHAGHGWGRLEMDTGVPGIGILEFDPRGWFMGGQIGYNYDVGGAILGVEADYQWANILYADTIPFGPPIVADREFGINHFGTVRARVGIDLDNYMPYLTGGLAFGELGSKTEVVGVSPPENYTDWALGLALGAGVEAAISDNLTLKTEYLYVDLAGAKLGPAGFQADGKAHAHTARIGLNYHF